MPLPSVRSALHKNRLQLLSESNLELKFKITKTKENPRTVKRFAKIPKLEKERAFSIYLFFFLPCHTHICTTACMVPPSQTNYRLPSPIGLKLCCHNMRLVGCPLNQLMLSTLPFISGDEPSYWSGSSVHPHFELRASVVRMRVCCACATFWLVAWLLPWLGSVTTS